MKAHLLTSEFPIVSGQNQTADCGKEIPKAQILFMWDEQGMGEVLQYTRHICSDCYLKDQGPRQRALIYGITERRQDEQSTDTTASEE